jgi:hypothetical protein
MPGRSSHLLQHITEGGPRMEAASVSGVPATPSRDELQELRHLLDGYRVSQAIYVVATQPVSTTAARP